MSKTATDDPNLSNSLPQLGDDAAQATVPAMPGGKEAEPVGISAEQSYIDEGKLVAQIETTSEELDKKALEVVEHELKEVRASHPQPIIPPDVEDAGVFNPQQEADNVVKNGSNILLPIDEAEYKKAMKEAPGGRWYRYDKVIVGSRGIVALALWAKRMISKAHKKAMKVVFRKGGE